MIYIMRYYSLGFIGFVEFVFIESEILDYMAYFEGLDVVYYLEIRLRL